MGVTFTNNADTTLATSRTDSETIFTLTGGGGAEFPTLGTGDYFYMTLVSQAGVREVIKVEYRNTDTLGSVGLPCTRGVDNTSAVAWDSADCKVQLRLPNIVLEEIVDDIATNAASIAALEGTLEAPSGLNMYFYENVAPTGWTINSGPADSLLSVKGGSEDYNVTGGQVGGSWTPTTHVHTGPSHVHDMDSHSHTITQHYHEVSSHNHQWYEWNLGGSDAHSFSSNGSNNLIDAGFGSFWGIDATDGSNDNLNQDYYTDNEAANNTSTDGPTSTFAESLGDSGAAGTGNTGTGSAPSSDRPKAAVGIVAEKD